MAEMGVYEAMRTLRAVRRLKPDPIPDEVLHRVLDAIYKSAAEGKDVAL